jgi:hypothetical protein
MKQFNLAVVGLIAAAALAVPVMAEEAPPAPANKPANKMEAFKKADVNADGKLSLEEYKTVAKGDADKKFTAADTDKDGFLSPEELKAARGKGKDKGKGRNKADMPVVPAPDAGQ